MKYITNLFHHKYFEGFFVLLFLFSIYFLVSAYSYVTAVSADLSDSVFRLHVIANSDTQEDQNLKYQVRDSLLSYMNQIAQNVTSKEEVIALVQNHQEEFEQIALQTIQKHGYDYSVSIHIGNFDFPTKEYGDISLPAGTYDALRVEIGEAQGHNWWCVMFPPLCFVDISSGIVPEESKDSLKNNLSDEEFSLISSDHRNEFNFKFKLIEMFENVKLKLAQN